MPCHHNSPVDQATAWTIIHTLARECGRLTPGETMPVGPVNEIFDHCIKNNKINVPLMDMCRFMQVLRTIDAGRKHFGRGALSLMPATPNATYDDEYMGFNDHLY